MNLFSKSRILRLVLLATAVVVVTVAGLLFWLSCNLKSFVEQTLRRTYGPELSLGAVETGWNQVVLRDLRVGHPGGGPISDRISIKRIILTPRFMGLLSRQIEIDLLRLENPRVVVEISPDGTVISPLSSRPAANPAAASAPPPFSLTIRQIEINQGEIIMLDRSAERLRMPGVSNRTEGFHLLRFSDIWFHTGPLGYPLSSSVLPITLSLKVPGSGTLTVTGSFHPVTLDAALKVTLRHWDITGFRPYYLKPGDLDVTRGFLDGDATVAIAAKKLHVPGEIRLSGLEVVRTGSQGAFLGMSAKMFLSVMKDRKGEIDTHFLLSGDLTNPRFKVQQSLVEQIGSGMARKLGVPVISDVGSGIINLGKKGITGIRNLFGGGK